MSNRRGFPRRLSPATICWLEIARCSRSFVRAVTKGHLYYGQYPGRRIALTQKVQRIDSQAMAKQIYDDDMLRHNPGGGLEEAAMRKVVERSVKC